MKVCYLWVEKFRNLENFEINLSSEYEFHYEKSIHSISRVKKNKLPKNFFYNGISDVSAFIGENGSGKSNCIEFICMALKGGKSRVKSNFIIITEDDGYYTAYQKFSKNTMAALSDFEVTKEEYDRSINGINVIYFSNISDDRYQKFDKSVSNISVNSKHHQENKFSNQISFIKSNRFKSLEIEVPEYLLIKVKYYSTVAEYINSDMVNEKLSLFIKLLRSKTKELSLQSQFSVTIKFALIFRLLKEIATAEKKKDSHAFIVKNFQFADRERTEAASYRIFESCINHPACKNLKIKDEIDLILERLDKNDFKLMENEESSGLTINFLVKYNDSFNRLFIDTLVDVFDSDKFLSFNWSGLSSGHTAYLTLFSSIYSELKRTRNDAIILIDEGDLYLHPKWQIEFFEKLLTVLPNLSTGNIQLVLTSHSPFLLSDLPNQCITILKSEGVKTNSIKLSQMTFGANLYELYSEVFFIGNKRTGTFAQKKIENLLSVIDKSKGSRNLISEVSSYQRIIGDKIINHHLNGFVNND
ncbi:AAA family ATPase [Shewanella sp.]|uniref:AAA family ATPase n=1 Tax=Shewanella sp. TaxID=50422 RepID=UPI0040543897